MSKSYPLVFFGSGPVAAKTLDAALTNFDITDVITKPQTAHGHRSLPPVEALAKRQGINLHTPADKHELAKLFESSSIPSKVGLVVDYGIIIPTPVIDYFEKGIVNSHFSLLPLWRGADPITFPLLAGDKTTGVSLMVINKAMDEGDLIAREELTISPSDTATSLSDKLVSLSNEMLDATLDEYVAGKVPPVPQLKNIEATYSRKLTKQDGMIDWNKTAIELERQVRAFTIWPKSYGAIAGSDVILTEVEVINVTGEPGTAVRQDGRLVVHCGKDALLVHKLKPAGKSEMSGESFLNGYGGSIS